MFIKREKNKENVHQEIKTQENMCTVEIVGHEFPEAEARGLEKPRAQCVVQNLGEQCGWLGERGLPVTAAPLISHSCLGLLSRGFLLQLQLSLPMPRSDLGTLPAAASSP